MPVMASSGLSVGTFLEGKDATVWCVPYQTIPAMSTRVQLSHSLKERLLHAEPASWHGSGHPGKTHDASIEANALLTRVACLCLHLQAIILKRLFAILINTFSPWMW